MVMCWIYYASLMILMTIPASEQISTVDSSTYVAGVIEFMPSVMKYRNETSAPDYLRIIYSEEASTTDILVFPEMTLNTVWTYTFVPESLRKIVPCGNDFYEEFLSSISCAAKITRKYIVVNVLEKSKCTPDSQASIVDTRPCATDGLNKYNTNVVFNRDGAVISRYRKWNLFGELGRNTTLWPDYGEFKTDFGVRFGHFICFDLMFKTPAQELVKWGITDFIFPTMWFSELPFLTAVQIQSAWSYANDVNLLAAGANNADRGSTGTGIYAGKRGTLVSVMRTVGEKQLYVAVVPKKRAYISQLLRKRQISNAIEAGDLFLKRDDIDVYNTILITNAKNVINQELCYDGLCCKFNISMTPKRITDNSSHYSYRLAVYNGHRSYTGVAKGSLKICGILACTNESMTTCGTRFSNTVKVENTFIFENIEIEGNFKDSRQMLLMPNSLDSNYMPIDVDEFYFNVEDMQTYKSVKYQLLKPKSNLLTFSIYANVFNRSGGSSFTIENQIFLVLSLIILYLSF